MPLTAHFEDIRSEIIANLSNSTNSVKAAIAWLTDTHIINTLHKLSSRNISIEIIINDDDINRTRGHVLRKLEQTGARIYYHGEEHGLMHHKFCIIDDRTLIMGSYNWTYAAAT